MGISKSTRFEIFKRDSFTCRYCGQKSPQAILEIDHMLPISAGGLDDYDNLITACFECNRGKAARLLTDIPEEPSLHEKAILIAEQELQVSEYNHWKAKQRERENSEIAELHKIWLARWSSDKSWKLASVRKFLRILGKDDLIDALEIVSEQTKLTAWSWELSAWKFFCGICYARMKG